MPGIIGNIYSGHNALGEDGVGDIKTDEVILAMLSIRKTETRSFVCDPPISIYLVTTRSFNAL